MKKPVLAASTVLLIGAATLLGLWWNLAARRPQPYPPAYRPVAEKVDLCSIMSHPEVYHGRLVEVTGVVAHWQESTSILDPTCKARLGRPVYIDYIRSSSSDRLPPKSLDGVPVPLVEDALFREFDTLMQRESVVVRATLVGRVSSASSPVGPIGERWNGGGFVSCCSLLALEQVRAVDRTNRTDIDYHADFGYNWDVASPQHAVGCSYEQLNWPPRAAVPLGDLLDWPPGPAVIPAQHRAEETEPWAFDDPQRVAVQALGRASRKSMSGVLLTEVRHAQGRFVYKWAPSEKESYTIFVSRPYVATLYARDSSKVAWIATMIWKVSCP
jgi:hypothetical protein